MGIPSYFSYILKNHKKIIKNLKGYRKEVHNLYLDSNSIIYDCLHKMDKKKYNGKEKAIFERDLNIMVCLKIEEYIKEVNPSNIVLIAFDGVVPLAKMNQQRQRRFKSQYTKEYLIEKSNVVNDESEEECFTWNQAAITPGTQFMKNLGEFVENYFRNFSSELSAKRVLISTSSDTGEGEHKIFKFIRENSKYHTQSNTFIYGLDADLIMLCLNHLKISKNIFLFRESPNFGVDKDEYEENELLFMDIYRLGQILVHKLNHTNLTSIENTKMNFDKIHDYIFFSFLLGNDFMPHFPALNIRTNGIHILMNTYKELFKNNETICQDDRIVFKKLKKFITHLAKNEMKNIRNETRIKNKYVVRESDKSDPEKYLHFIPNIERDEEEYLCPYKDGYSYRYYNRFFHIKNPNDTESIDVICKNYLHGLMWNFEYYNVGCHDYSYSYNYSYPPMLQDLARFIPVFDMEITEDNYCIVDEKALLAYVLPKNTLTELLDHDTYEKIKNIKNMLNEEFEFKWAYCKYFWESHVELPEVNVFDIHHAIVG